MAFSFFLGVAPCIAFIKKNMIFAFPKATMSKGLWNWWGCNSQHVFSHMIFHFFFTWFSFYEVRHEIAGGHTASGLHISEYGCWVLTNLIQTFDQWVGGE